MILIHKETAEIYEMRIKSVVYDTVRNKSELTSEHNSYTIFLTYEIGEPVLVGATPINITPNKMAETFEILGWL